jgi:hypothetical protein
MSNSRKTNTRTHSADYIEPTQIGGFSILPNNYVLGFLQLSTNKMQTKLFMLIYAKYQSVSYKKKAVCPFYASYADFAKVLGCNDPKRIRGEIKALIEMGIIQRTTGRKGRSKYGYIIDNKALNDIAENV